MKAYKSLHLKYPLVGLFVLLQFIGFGQSAVIQRANNLIIQKEYQSAIDVLKNIDYLNDNKVIFNKGYCHFKLRELDAAESHFLAAHKLGHQSYELYFLMGQIRHAQGKYRDASMFYKQAFKKCKHNKSSQKRIINALNSAANSEKMEFKPSDDVVVNLGSIINSSHDEICPLPSPSQQGLIYYSSDRDNYLYDENDSLIVERRNADVYKALISNNEVVAHGLANEQIKTPKDEYLMDITNDGQILFYLQGDQRKEVFSDTFLLNDTRHTAVSPINAVMRTEGMGEMDVIMDSIFIFSSNKPGGYGGYDLYFTLKRGNTWLEGENMGPEINTSFDEKAPFLTLDGKHLYFSTNRNGGLGGFDVYKSGFSEIERRWSKPKNLKKPINSSQDELNFKVTLNDPKTAYLASNRLLDNQGGFDVYKIILSEKAWENKINSPPLFFTNYMASDYIPKIFKVANGSILMPTQDDLSDHILDSLELVQLEYENIIRQQIIMDSLAYEKQLQDAQINTESTDLQLAEWEAKQAAKKIKEEEEAQRLADLAALELKIKEEKEAREKAEQAQKERDAKAAEKEAREARRIAEREAEKKKKEAQKEEKERLKAERKERDRIAAEEREAERKEMERLKAEQKEKDRLEAEQRERDRIAAEKQEAERKEMERLKAEQKEKDRLEAEQKERNRIAAEEQEAERMRLEQARLEKERLENQARQDSIAAANLLAQQASLNFQTTYLEHTDKTLHFTEEIRDDIITLVRVLESYPNSFVELEGFYAQEGPSMVYDLYNSMKLAETVKQELIKRSVATSRISLKAHGYSYNKTNIEASSEAHKRVLVRVVNKDPAGHIPIPDVPYTNESKSTPYYNDYLTKVEGLSFRVEGMKMKRMLANKALEDVQDIMMEQLPNERNFTYVFGVHKSFDQALALQRSLLLDYKMRAPVVRAYINGSQITEQQARYIIGDYSELEAYIRYLEN